MRFSLSLQIAAILIITTEITSAAPASKQKPSSKATFSLGGERLPVTTMDDFGDPRNERWQDIARVLRVRDLRVYQWPSAYNVAGGAEKQKQETLTQLKTTGYKVEKVTWHWSVTGYPPTFTGFRANRGNEMLSALWTSNGSFLFLYWGHPLARTPARQLDDGLIGAVIAGQESRVEEFLKRGASPNAVDYGGASVLTLAAASHRARIVSQLLAAREAHSPDTSAADFSTAMKIASAANDTATLQALFDAGATPSQVGDALQVAASTGGATEAAALLTPQALPSDVDRALIAASFSGMWRGSALQYPDVVKLLLARKPSKKALDAALLAASEDDQMHVVPLLLAAGANVETRDPEGKTILLRAASGSNLHDLRVDELLEAGADVNARDKEGNTALMWAVVGGFPSEIKLLLGHGVDPHALNKKGQSALDWSRSLAKTSRGSEKAKYLAIMQLLRSAEAQNPKL